MHHFSLPTLCVPQTNQRRKYCNIIKVDLWVNNLSIQFLLLKQRMSDNNSLSHLLAWANNEWRVQGNASVIYDFEQLRKTGFLYELLQKIHPTYFQGLNHLGYYFQTYFPLIEGYLIELEGKKMKRGYKRILGQQQSISEMIKLVLYLLLQSSHKSEYINRIFEMHVDLQTYFMQELKKVDQSLENYIEIKDILFTVEKLEEENQELKDKLKTINEAAKQLQQTVAQTRSENKRIEKQVSKYEQEKKTIMDELQIIDMRDYIEIYKCVRQENEDLTQCINEAQQRRKEMQAENCALRDKIGEDCQIITSLNDQIVKVRSNYEQACDQVSLLTVCHRNSCEDSALRENKNFNNTNTKISLETSCSAMGTSKILWQLQEEDDERQRLRTYNREIMEKLENAYRSISELGDEVIKLKQEKGKLQRKNQFLQKKVSDIKKQQSRFVKQLRSLGL